MDQKLEDAFDEAIEMLHKFAEDQNVTLQGTIVLTDSNQEASVYTLQTDDEEENFKP